MNVLLINLFPTATIARYQLASYILKAYVNHYSPGEYDIDVLNMPKDVDQSNVVSKVLAKQPDVIGFSCYSWNMNKVRKIIHSLKDQSDAPIICGGPEISLESIPQARDGQHANYYVIGEGEKPFHELLAKIKADPSSNGTDLPAGVAVFHDGTTTFDAKAEPFASLDAIPSIYLENAIEERFINHQQAFIETQRGCRNRCSYCLYHHHRDHNAYYSLDRVREELTHLIVQRKITALRFMDATLTSDLERAKRIVEHLAAIPEEHDIELPWIYWEWTYAGVDDEFIELVSRLKKKKNIYNCDTVPAKDAPQCYNDLLTDYVAINGIGVQSLHAPSLRAVRRSPILWDRFHGFMESVRQRNVVLKIDLILGLPHETPETFLHGLDTLLPLLKGTDHVLNIHRLQMLSGSLLYDQADQLGLVCAPDLPRYVLSTPTIPAREMIELNRISGMLFRVVNSPMRTKFFKAFEELGGSVQSVIEALLNKAAEIPEKAEGHLFSDDVLADEYWNRDIFRDVDSQWLEQALDDLTARR